MNERLRLLEQFYIAFREGDQRRHIVAESIGVYSDLWVPRMLEAYGRLQELDASPEPEVVYALVDADWRHGDSILAVVTNKERAGEIQKELMEKGEWRGILWHPGTSLGVEIREYKVVDRW